ncbi:hypothetical protein [Argonema galeatum]|uniref:hypothetical protein n=1 Tax=Argonema galeatum TaxID=2942762 RepID=UPI002013A432|nr:hypothetical protein [Argonema galeatum]MCL1467374.1 hypothetical protein [Argonema galeatum A003/A1]
MSKQVKSSATGSNAGAKGFSKESTFDRQKSPTSQQQSANSVIAVPPVLPSSGEGSINITFSAVMLNLQITTLLGVITEAAKQIESYTSQLNELAPTVAQEVLITDSKKIIDYINILIQAKALVAGMLSWMAVVASIAHHLVVSLEEHLPDELINEIETSLSAISSTCDAALTSIPSNSILGITLAPDQKLVSETKAIISDVFLRIEKIKQENEEANQDWGAVEQKAYERILEDSSRNVSKEEFLSWLSDLEQGHDV